MENDLEWFNIIDTAIKIGLGALIGGLSGVLLARINNKNQRKTNDIERRRRILENILERIDEFSESTTTFWASVRNLIDKKNKKIEITEDEKVELSIMEKRLWHNFTIINSCRSRLLLIGAKDSESKLSKYRGLIEQLFEMAYLDNTDCTLDTLDKLKNEISSARRTFYESLNTEYEKK